MVVASESLEFHVFGKSWSLKFDRNGVAFLRLGGDGGYGYFNVLKSELFLLLKALFYAELGLYGFGVAEVARF